MVQVKQNTKKAKHRTGKGKNGRDSFEITLVWTRSDIKTFLQKYLLELKMYHMPNKYTQKELIELFRTRLFELVPDRSAQEMAEWAFDIGMRLEYFTSNRWDKDKPTIYFIDEVILTIKPGRKGIKQIQDYEDSKENEL